MQQVRGEKSPGEAKQKSLAQSGALTRAYIALLGTVITHHHRGATDLLRSLLAWANLPRALFAFSQAG